MSENISCPQSCNEHGAITTKIQQLEQTIKELKENNSEFITRKELKTQMKYIEEQISSLKSESVAHYEKNTALQETLARLDEVTKYLKESLATNQRTTEQLMEKVDKMYELMLNNLNKPKAIENDAPKNEIKIINDSNNKSSGSSEKENPFKSIGEFVKDYGTIVIILVAIIAYLVTGHWPLPIGAGTTPAH